MHSSQAPAPFRVALAVLATGIIVPGLLSSEPTAPTRTGLWATQKLPNDSGTLEEFASQLKDSKYLAGVCLHIPWDQIEKNPGKPDFSAIDETVAILRKSEMRYQLCLKPGAYTPLFVYADGAQAFETRVTNPHRANVGAAIKIPVPWDPVYQRDFSRIIQLLGQRYAPDPLCVSVVLTCANFLSAEMHLPKTRSDLSRWQSLGDYETRLFEVYKNILMSGPRRSPSRRSPSISPKCSICRPLSVNASSSPACGGIRNVSRFRTANSPGGGRIQA